MEELKTVAKVDNKISTLEVIELPINQVERHPYNRPLGINTEKVEQLKNLILKYGYDETQPIKVRPYNDKYQIIAGEYRYLACKKLSLETIPCVIKEADDLEALLFLIADNTQSENKPLEIGLNAIETKKQIDMVYGTFTFKDYGEKIGGLSQQRISQYVTAGKVYNFVKEKSQKKQPGLFLEDIKKLIEIHKLNQSDWVFIHNYILENDLSKEDTIKICKAIRKLDDVIKLNVLYEIFDIQDIKENIIPQALKDKASILNQHVRLIELIQDLHEKLDFSFEAYTYGVEKDIIENEIMDLKNMFVRKIKSNKDVTKQTINEDYKFILSWKINHTKEATEQEQKYYKDKEHQKELEERLRLEKEQKEYIFFKWLACNSISDIVQELSINKKIVMENLIDEKFNRLNNKNDRLALYDPFSENTKVQVYTVMSRPHKSGNKIKYPGQIPPEIVEHLLYYLTDFFDIVLDPFGGGGTTIDVCKQWYRRYFVSDIEPISGLKVTAEREEKIRQWDLNNGIPHTKFFKFHPIKLTFLDPPYYKKKEGDYSENSISSYDKKQYLEFFEKLAFDLYDVHRSNTYVALLMSNYVDFEDRNYGSIFIHRYVELFEKAGFFTNRWFRHDLSPEQYQGYQVDQKKKKKEEAVIDRDLIIFMKV